MARSSPRPSSTARKQPAVPKRDTRCSPVKGLLGKSKGALLGPAKGMSPRTERLPTSPSTRRFTEGPQTAMIEMHVKRPRLYLLENVNQTAWHHLNQLLNFHRRQLNACRY